MPQTTAVLLSYLLLVTVLSFGAANLDTAQTAFALDVHNEPPITFTNTWHSLGPFRIGTREAVWGSDPLESVGGFNGVPRDEESCFHSPLTANATVCWNAHEVETAHLDNEAIVRLDIGYDHVDWSFQQQVYGWSALQYQAWIRGELYNHASKPRRVWIFPEGILELSINSQHFFGGDFFAFNRAPILVSLVPGLNTVNIRLIRDVRAMGGTNPPRIEAKIHVKLAQQQLELDDSLSISPELVESRLPSHYFSIVVRNPLDDWITVLDCKDDSSVVQWTRLSSLTRIAPGQSRTISLRISGHQPGVQNVSGSLYYSITSLDEPEELRLPFTFHLRQSSISSASKFTFVHPGGVVSYAILKPPATLSKEATIPLLALLHGAGLEADSSLVRHSLDEITDLDTFALFPTGMSPWSGDDWHIWGTADALSAIDAVKDWMAEMMWNGSLATVNRIVISGHSNGGQGTWYFATHLPDRTIAAAPLSGYTSIENYVSYSMWRESDPLRLSILNTARSSYRHELLLENLVDIPILQQHGSADDNVPPYHSRLMSSLRSEAGMQSDYIEFANKPHWWDGAPTTKPLQQFYRRYLKQEQYDFSAKTFSLVVPGCGQIGSKHGIVVDQLQSPDRLGRIEVIVQDDADGPVWWLTTTNIFRLHFNFTDTHVKPPLRVAFSADSEYTLLDVNNITPEVSCTKERGRTWKCLHTEWKQIGQRYGRQRGGLDAIMHSAGKFKIVACGESISLAVQVSRNLYQYYGADSEILSCEEYVDAMESAGNLILLSNGLDIPPPQLVNFPIHVIDGDVHLRMQYRDHQHIIAGQPGMGASFLRPLHDERLELVVWGSDLDGLRQAARLVPTVTGAGQPDFTIFGTRARIQGCGGTISMGLFDYGWNISEASYIP